MYKLITPYADSFGGTGKKANVIIKHFPDTESYVQIPQINSLKGKKVTIYHRLYPDPDKRIFELLLILDLVKKQTKEIELFVPYLPYARQDRASKKGEAVSADILCNMLKNYGVKKLTTFDCHFLYGPGIFMRAGLKIENKSAGKILYAEANKYFNSKKTTEKFLVISPDESASYFTENAQGHSLKKMRKVAEATGIGTGIHADVDKMEGDIDVKGKNVCIMDDMISTGGTVMRAIKHLQGLGAKEIIVGTTHGIFTGENIAKKIIQAGASHIFTTDSILTEKIKEVEILKLPTTFK